MKIGDRAVAADENTSPDGRVNIPQEEVELVNFRKVAARAHNEARLSASLSPVSTRLFPVPLIRDQEVGGSNPLAPTSYPVGIHQLLHSICAGRSLITLRATAIMTASMAASEERQVIGDKAYLLGIKSCMR